MLDIGSFRQIFKRQNKMKCIRCKKEMKHLDKIKFNEYEIPGWKCFCGEIYYEPKQAEKILLLNKLKNQPIKVKLGQIRSNLILYLPKDIEKALSLHKGENVSLKIDGNSIKISTN